MADNQDKLMEKLTDALNSIGLDIREIKTTLKHFDEKFGQVQKDLSNVKIQVGEAEHDVEALKISLAKLELKTKENKDDIERLFVRNKERDREDVVTKRWNIGTAISVLAMIIGIVFNLIK